MLHVFSTNRVKLATRTPTTTSILGQREYVRIPACFSNSLARVLAILYSSISHNIVFFIETIQIRELYNRYKNTVTTWPK
jgi:hypothetical protein